MIRRLVGAAVLLLGAFALVGPAAPASAVGGPSDYADCILTVVPATFVAGATVDVLGEGFQPNFQTTITFDDPAVVLGTPTTDATGAFTTQVQIPDGAAPGPHTISAVCDVQGNISSTAVTVSSTAVPPAAPLPRTGSDSTEPLVVAGGLALLAGIAFVVVARRRHRSHVGV